MSVRTVLLVLVAVPIAACAPPCGQVCRKLLFDCELDTERVAFEECELSCQQQELLYSQWENRDLAELFDDQKRCVTHSSCEEIADGVCYEGYEDLYVFDPDKELPEPITSEDTGT